MAAYEQVDAASSTKVLVTGGSGFLGQHLIHYIQDITNKDSSLHDITYTFCTVGSDLAPGSGIKGVHMDLKDPQSVIDALNTCMPDVIVHTAASSSPAFCAKNQDEANLVNAPVALLDAIDKVQQTTIDGKRPLVIYLSTDQVYSGNEKEAPYLTSTSAIPVNAYGDSKLKFEEILKESGQGHFVVLRSSNMVGPPSPFTNITKFLQWLESKLSQDQEIDLFEDEVRSYLHVHDVCEIITRIINKWTSSDTSSPVLKAWVETGMIYNMGGPEPLSRVGIAQLLCGAHPEKYSALLKTGDPKIKPSKRADLDQMFGYTSPMDISMDSSKIEEDLNFKFRSLRGSV